MSAKAGGKLPAEACPGAQGTQINFTDCVASQTTINGSIVLSGDGSSGLASVAVSLNGVAVNGTVSYETDATCLNQTYALSATSDDLSATVVGTLTYCSPPEFVNDIIVPSAGNLMIGLPNSDRTIELWFYEGESPGSYSLYVWNSNLTEQLLFCTGVLFGGIECGPPPTE
jgi:hypothetical protein